MSKISDERLADAPTLEQRVRMLTNFGGASERAKGYNEAIERVCQMLSTLEPQQEEPDAYVDWSSQCIYVAENIKDPTGLQPVWFAHPTPVQESQTVSDEMVERALSAYGMSKMMNGPHRAKMRAALTAALAPS